MQVNRYYELFGTSKQMASDSIQKHHIPVFVYHRGRERKTDNTSELITAPHNSIIIQQLRCHLN